jgi:D-xylose transport system substrate-binding protein
MFKVIQDGGATILPDKDANLSTTQQITDVNTLIEQGANVLILLAQDTKAIGPALQAAKDNNIPVIAYDRLIEDPDVLYITFDNQGVGVAEATAIMQKVPEGNYVIIKGDPGDPNAAIFLRNGYDVAGLKDAVDAGKIKILDEQFTPGWDTKKAQTTMEAIIDKANADGNTIDAVLAENDSTSLGVAAALQAKSYDPYPPTSGQDGEQQRAGQDGRLRCAPAVRRQDLRPDHDARWARPHGRDHGRRRQRHGLRYAWPGRQAEQR